MWLQGEDAGGNPMITHIDTGRQMVLTANIIIWRERPDAPGSKTEYSHPSQAQQKWDKLLEALKTRANWCSYNQATNSQYLSLCPSSLCTTVHICSKEEIYPIEKVKLGHFPCFTA